MDDPLFSAHRIFDNPTTNSTLYISDSLNTVIACVNQYQLRSPSDNLTTAVGSWFDTALAGLQYMVLSFGRQEP